MKVVLFCGGLGTRLREHSDTIPKPLVNIGPRPIIWHLMRYYAHFGHRDFILCLGYRGDLIREFFLNYSPFTGADFTLSGGTPRLLEQTTDVPDWSITFVETGLHTNIGGRLGAVERHVSAEPMFLANYSDQLSDLPLPEYVNAFEKSGAVAGFASVRPSYSSHSASVDDSGLVTTIDPMSAADVWINGGYFVMRPEIFRHMRLGEELVEEPFRRLVTERRLYSMRYTGFWKAMDTFKDKITYDRMWGVGDTPWQVWRSRSKAGSDAAN